MSAWDGNLKPSNKADRQWDVLRILQVRKYHFMDECIDEWVVWCLHLRTLAEVRGWGSSKVLAVVKLLVKEGLVESRHAREWSDKRVLEYRLTKEGEVALKLLNTNLDKVALRSTLNPLPWSLSAEAESELAEKAKEKRVKSNPLNQFDLDVFENPNKQLDAIDKCLSTIELCQEDLQRLFGEGPMKGELLDDCDNDLADSAWADFACAVDRLSERYAQAKSDYLERERKV